MPYYVDYYKAEVIRSDCADKGPYRWRGDTFETMAQVKRAIDEFTKELRGHYWPYL